MKLLKHLYEIEIVVECREYKVRGCPWLAIDAFWDYKSMSPSIVFCFVCLVLLFFFYCWLNPFLLFLFSKFYVFCF